MSTVRTNFAGLRLRNPIIAASSPATETPGRIARCAAAGAGAVVTKSISCENKRPLTSGCRRMFVDAKGLWGTSTFARETLGLAAGCRLIAETTTLGDIPVIASIAARNAAIESWLPACAAAADAGAAAIQLDFFYLNDISHAGIAAMRDVIRELCVCVPVPIIPKLNVDISARDAAETFRGTGIGGISLLDSVTIPPPIRLNTKITSGLQFIRGPSGTSLFGAWQLPLAMHYTDVLATNTQWDLMAGGGVADAKDAINLLIAGAKTVQVATQVLVNGFGFITKLVNGVSSFLDEQRLESVDALRVAAHTAVARSAAPEFPLAVAQVVPVDCTQCGRCLRLAFCDAIQASAAGPQVIPALCDGCSACAAFCPHHAIAMCPVQHNVQCLQVLQA